jgi:hypothetical protein
MRPRHGAATIKQPSGSVAAASAHAHQQAGWRNGTRGVSHASHASAAGLQDDSRVWSSFVGPWCVAIGCKGQVCLSFTPFTLQEISQSGWNRSRLSSCQQAVVSLACLLPGVVLTSSFGCSSTQQCWAADSAMVSPAKSGSEQHNMLHQCAKPRSPASVLHIQFWLEYGVSDVVPTFH